ncbi:MAG: hypothetical protein Q9182_001461 [Xanthomendoza sp. 2 TL-2023]
MVPPSIWYGNEQEEKRREFRIPPGYPWSSPPAVTSDQIDQLFDDHDHPNRAPSEHLTRPGEGSAAAHPSSEYKDKSSPFSISVGLATPADSSPNPGGSHGLQTTSFDGCRIASTSRPKSCSRTDCPRTPETDVAEEPVTPMATSKSKTKAKSREKKRSKGPETSHPVRSRKASHGASRTSTKKSRLPSPPSTQNSVSKTEKKRKKKTRRIAVLEKDDAPHDAVKRTLCRRHGTAPPPSLIPMSPAIAVKAAMKDVARAPLLSLSQSSLNKPANGSNVASKKARIDGRLSDAELLEMGRTMGPSKRHHLAGYAFSKRGPLYAKYRYLAEMTDGNGRGWDAMTKKRLTRK